MFLLNIINSKLTLNHFIFYKIIEGVRHYKTIDHCREVQVHVAVNKTDPSDLYQRRFINVSLSRQSLQQFETV